VKRPVTVIFAIVACLMLSSLASHTAALYLALGVPGLGGLLMCALFAWPAGIYLRQHPTKGSGVFVGLGRASLLNISTAFSPDFGPGYDLLRIFALVVFLTVLWESGPKDGIKRLLARLTPRVRSFSRPVMGGA